MTWKMYRFRFLFKTDSSTSLLLAEDLQITKIRKMNIRSKEKKKLVFLYHIMTIIVS